MNNNFLTADPAEKSYILLSNDRYPENTNSFLRPLRIEDVDEIYMDALNNSKIRRWIAFTSKNKASLESIRSYVLQNLNDPGSVLFGFYLEKKLSGTVRLHNIFSTKPQIGIAIFDLKIWGKSWATVILHAVAKFAFTELELKSIYAGIDRKNIGSIKAFGKAGFEKFDEIEYEMGNAVIMKLQKSL